VPLCVCGELPLAFAQVQTEPLTYRAPKRSRQALFSCRSHETKPPRQASNTRDGFFALDGNYL